MTFSLLVCVLSLEIQACEIKLVKSEEIWKSSHIQSVHILIVKGSSVKTIYITVIILKLTLHEITGYCHLFLYSTLEYTVKGIVYIYNQSSDLEQKGLEECYLI